jgi:hypothetical protein
MGKRERETRRRNVAVGALENCVEALVAAQAREEHTTI